MIAATTVSSKKFDYSKYHKFKTVTATCYRPRVKDTIAIHKFPKGTVIELMIGNRKVKGVVRDRGPWKGNKPHPTKIIDISEWLATRLGFKNAADFGVRKIGVRCTGEWVRPGRIK